MRGKNQNFRLTNEPGGMGLSCTNSGLSLAGVALLRKSAEGFFPRSTEEIRVLLRAAYGSEIAANDVLPAFGAVARSLNRGEIAQAMISAVLMGLPELSWESAARIANADERLSKYNDSELRDWHGRWSDDAGADAAGQDRLPEHEVASDPAENLPSEPTSNSYPQSQISDGEDNETTSTGSPLERKYDNLNPVELAREVIKFGELLGRDGQTLSPAAQQDALAEYQFLQNRLSFWLHYDNKPLEAQSNLISAAQTLYEGAINGGIVTANHIPHSMLIVAGGAFAANGNQPSVSLPTPSIRTGVEETPAVRTVPPDSEDIIESELSPTQVRFPAITNDIAQAIQRPEDRWQIVNKDVSKVDWDHGATAQGETSESYFDIADPGARSLKPGTKAFDAFREQVGEAISEKSLDPLKYTYASNPRNIYSTVKKYVNSAADYNKPRVRTDLSPEAINSRTLKLIIRDYVAPEQWESFHQAEEYAKQRNVSLIIVRER